MLDNDDLGDLAQRIAADVWACAVMPILPLSEHEVARFYRFVERGSDDQCWPWVGAKRQKDGRGRFMLHGRNMSAPRVCWAVANQQEPAGHVCHRCDTPNCVNPAHLWVGSNADNMADCARKGRHWQANKTHCPQGHEYTPENTGFCTRSYGRDRLCRACIRTRRLSRREKANA